MGPGPIVVIQEKSPPISPLKVIALLSFVCQINSALLSWLGEATPTKNISYPSFSPKQPAFLFLAYFSFFPPSLTLSIRL